MRHQESLVLVRTKDLYDVFFRSKLTEHVQVITLAQHIALHLASTRFGRNPSHQEMSPGGSGLRDRRADS